MPFFNKDPGDNSLFTGIFEVTFGIVIVLRSAAITEILMIFIATLLLVIAPVAIADGIIRIKKKQETLFFPVLEFIAALLFITIGVIILVSIQNAQNVVLIVIGAILAAILLKLGTYGFVRIALPFLPQAAKTWAPIIAVLAVIGIIYGALGCLAQTDMKRLIAFSSVAHMGFVMLGIATLTDFGFNAAIFGMVAHGLITGMLFFIAGSTKDRFHTLEIKRLGGLLLQAPRMGWLLAFSCMASLGLPGLAGFWSEFLVFRGAFDLVKVYAAVGVLGIVITAAYILWKIIQFMFLGDYDPHKIDHWTNLTTGRDEHEPSDMATFEKVTMWPLVAFMVLFGIFPTPLLNFFNLAANELLQRLM